MRMLHKLFIFFASIWFSALSYSQSDFTACDGSMLLSPNVWHTLSFKGKVGKDKSGISYYCNLPVKTNNFIYFHFSFEKNGQLTINTKTEKDSLVLFVFDVPTNLGCKAIRYRKANLVACERRSPTDTVFQHYFIQGDKNYQFLLYSPSNKTLPVSIKLSYFPSASDGKYIKDSLMLNLVNDPYLPVYDLHFRDAITLLPVVAKLALFASSPLDGTYRGSEIKLNNQKKLSARLQIDAEGYYPKEIRNHAISAVNQSDTFYLTPITHGSITKLDDIFFVGGLAIILDESLPRLKKLRDFLVLNESVSIEIQGHVNEEGSNSLRSKQLSKNRAKKIMDYLIKSGINPKRLSAVGMGNSMPVYKNPETDEQKEANRRVEIKIK